MRRRLFYACTVAVLAALVSAPSSAQAAGCSIGGSGISYNQRGIAAKFKSLKPMGTMNCPSARYVLNRWLRRAFERSSARRLPTRFFDGYVTWSCFKLEPVRWQCNEYVTDTSFRFTAFIL